MATEIVKVVLELVLVVVLVATTAIIVAEMKLLLPILLLRRDIVDWLIDMLILKITYHN